MPITPKYFAVQEEGVIDNILFIMERGDFKEVLDIFNPIEAALPDTDPRYLLDFQERTLGQFAGLVYPALAIGPNTSASVQADAADRLIEAVKFSARIGVTDDNAQNVTRRVMKYAVAFEAVLRTAATKNKADFFRNMSNQMFGLVLDEVEKFYGPIGTRESIFYRSVRIDGTIRFNEA